MIMMLCENHMFGSPKKEVNSLRKSTTSIPAMSQKSKVFFTVLKEEEKII